MAPLSRIRLILCFSTAFADGGVRSVWREQRMPVEHPLFDEWGLKDKLHRGEVVVEMDGGVMQSPVRRVLKAERIHHQDAALTLPAEEGRPQRPVMADKKALREARRKRTEARLKRAKSNKKQGGEPRHQLQVGTHHPRNRGLLPTLKKETKRAKAKRKARKMKSASKTIDPSVSYKTYCRTPNPVNGAWMDCAFLAQSSRQELTSTDQTPATSKQSSDMIQAASPFKMLSQTCLNAAGHGKWKAVMHLDDKSLGSNSRYAGTNFFLGPPTQVLKEDPGLQRIPHAREHTGAACSDCPEFVWKPANSSKSCPRFGWMLQNETQSCVAGSWIALWGDSTMRMVFSALVDFLGDGIQHEGLPTHDFTFHEHSIQFDHCRNGRCFEAVHFPKYDILVTFDFVTRIKDWPDLWETMGYYADTETFPELLMKKAKPDLVLLNSGPWEHYWRGERWNHPWDGDQQYMERFGQFLNDHFVSKDQTTALLILRNTACPQQIKCEGTNTSCVSAMANIHTMQTQVVHDFVEKHPTARVRYSDGLFVHTVPDGYRCRDETGFHLPGVITDIRLNHALHAVCRLPSASRNEHLNSAKRPL